MLLLTSFRRVKLESSYSALFQCCDRLLITSLWRTAEYPVEWFLFPQWGVEITPFQTDTCSVQKALLILQKFFIFNILKWQQLCSGYMFGNFFFLIILLTQFGMAWNFQGTFNQVSLSSIFFAQFFVFLNFDNFFSLTFANILWNLFEIFY